jgi:multiple sugar transport system substrate-binding protein
MVVLAVGGCGGGDDPENKPVTITHLRHDNPPYAMADDQAFAAYTAAHPNVKIENSTVKYQTLGSKLLTELKADHLDGIDLVRVIPSWVCSFAANLADVPEDIVTLGQAQSSFFAAPLAGSICDGKLKGLPIEYNLEYGGVVVNMDQYQAKFPGKTPSWNDWGAFIDEAASLTQYDSTGKPRANGLDIELQGWPQPAKHIFLSQILQRGGKYWTGTGEAPNFAKGDNFDFTNEHAKATLTEMVKWVNDKKILHRELIPEANTFVTTRLAMGATGYGWSDVTKPLSIMGYAGTWAVPNTVSQVPAGMNTKYEFHALPPMVGAQHKFVQNSGFALVVPKTSKNQKLAWEIAKSIALSPEGARKWTTIGGALPALKANATTEAVKADPMLAKVVNLLDQGRWVGFIPAGAIETVEGAIVSSFYAAVAGTKTIDQALMEMQTTANNALMQNR